jgi:hypothetical protein
VTRGRIDGPALALLVEVTPYLLRNADRCLTFIFRPALINNNVVHIKHQVKKPLPTVKENSRKIVNRLAAVRPVFIEISLKFQAQFWSCSANGFFAGSCRGRSTPGIVASPVTRSLSASETLLPSAVLRITLEKVQSRASAICPAVRV